MPDEYQAIAFADYGDPSVLRPVLLPLPEPGPGQVRIGVRAAGVNPLDWKLRAGELVQMMPVDLPHVPGTDVAGVIEAIGERVDGLQVGDEVFGKALTGSYAQQALVQVGRIAVKPASLSWEFAAALPVAATTAHHALGVLAVRRGETVVVNGASGGVGTFAVQLARRTGATVIGTASERNHDYLRSLGVLPVSYGEDLAQRIAAAAPQGIDAALDVAGHDALPALIEAVGRPGRVVTLVDFAADQLGARFLFGEPEDVPAILAEVADLAATGEVTVPITTYPLADAATAHAANETGHARGKLVLVPR